MALSEEGKEFITNLIFERAYSIEDILSDGDFLQAKTAGVKPDDVSEIALKIAIKEIKEILAEISG